MIFNWFSPKPDQIWKAKKPLRGTCPDISVRITRLQEDISGITCVFFSDIERKYEFSPVPVCLFKKMFEKA
ncbi:hypothetical protein UFOVP273_94 [uncultured Caudovirales phage]|uniref:Uncharacterized protein n=1 Tax=uncultured Caudovirales phage TaxID=2100421 RepID=A0A6J5LJW8_9CAUD|nr:hypothetical protein UFOVP273_94 [uncultured Caudovirales phage]